MEEIKWRIEHDTCPNCGLEQAGVVQNAQPEDWTKVHMKCTYCGYDYLAEYIEEEEEKHGKCPHYEKSDLPLSECASCANNIDGRCVEW